MNENPSTDIGDSPQGASDLNRYRAFIASRAVASQMQGFTPTELNPMAKAHQRAALDFALRRGKSAAFLDTGLGKSFIELEFARQCAEETGKPSLIRWGPWTWGSLSG
jgi:hypothetical protein